MNLTASSIPRLLACPASGALPHHEYSTQFAADGQDRHGDMEAAADVGDHEALPEVVASLILPGDRLYAETSFAYDVSSDIARMIGPVHRKYGDLGPYEVGGTPDLVIIGSGRGILAEYKSFESVEDAESNTQTLTTGLMVARWFALDELTVVIAYLGGLRKPSVATLSVLDFDAHAARLKQLQFDVAQAAANPSAYLKTGAHCRYCPAFLSCPVQNALKKQASNGELALITEAAIPFRDDEDAARAFDLLARIKLLTTRMSAALYARAKDRPIPLGDGKFLGEVEKQGNRQIDGDAAYVLVRQKYGQEVADRAVTREASQKGIEDALKAAGIAAPKKAKDGLVKELETSGAVTRKTSRVIEVYEHKLQLVEGGKS